MRKRITSLLLTLVMLLSLVPAMGVTASAADDTSYTQAEIRDYDTFATYLRSFDSRDLKLVEDINYTVGIKDVPINVIRNQKLDLNGHKITIDASRRTGFVHLLSIRRGEFTLYDSVGGGELAVAFPDDNKAYSIIMMSSENEDEPSKFTMNGGTLTKLRPNMTYTYGASGCIGDDYFNKPENGKRSQITINGGTINCAYDWDRSKSLLSLPVEAMPLALQLLYSNLTINGGTFNGIVWTDELWRREQDTEPRVVLNGGVFNSPFVVEGMQKDATQIVIDGAHFKDGFHVDKVGRYRIMDVGTVPVLLLKSGVFDSPDKNPKLDIYNVTANSYGNGVNSDATARARLEMILHAMKCFPNSAIKVNGKFYTSENIESLVGKNIDDFYLKLNSSTPIEVIRDAWGVMESVTLDGNPIDYAKDWKGEVERMDNSTAHTLKFEWKPLAQELKDAGYSYRTKCEHYISGSSAVQHTDTIAADETSHTITIPAGADPKVYSYDLQLNLDKNGSSVGIISNEHIVKLVVSEAPVVEPDPTIAGKVYYTSGIVYGRPISTAASVTPADATKAYQWQRSTDSGSTWTDIERATSGRYTPVAADMGENVRIRVVVTAEGYLGEIVGAAVKVSKAANDNTPAPPAVGAQKDDSDAYTKFEISDFNSNQEYVYTSSPASGSEWPTGGTEITSATVENLTAGSTYYIYTRYKETDTHTAGSKISSSSVLLDEITKLNRIVLTDESGKVYGSYGNGNTIYIQNGTSMTLTATTNPSGANRWSAFTFKSQYNASAPFTVTAPTDSVASGAEIPTVTIHGDTAGTGTLAAEYGGYPAPQSYGTWRVHVYENVSDIGTGAEITVSSSFPDMTMYQDETMPLPEHNASVYPVGALDNYNLAWRIIKVGSGGAAYSMSDDNITLDDGKIKATASHTAPSKTRLELVAVNKTDDMDIRSFSPSIGFYVTVTEAPAITLTGLTVAPAKVNLELNATYQFSAVKQPANAPGSLTWTSDNPTVAEVDTTGKVTAKAHGTAKITVTCNGKSASCTVTVGHTHDTDGQPWVYMDPGMHIKTCTAGDDFKVEVHDFGNWTPNSDNTTHSRHCNKCKKSGETENYTETANHNWQWKVDTAATPNAEGKKHEECVDCGAKRSENTTIPMLPSIKVENLTVAKPVKDAAAAAATTADSAYTVAYTEWTAADGTSLVIGDKFQPGTVYTAKITLETSGSGVFSAKSTYNPIEGKTATATPVLTGDTHADSVILSYTFDATEGSTGGSTGGGGGSGGGGVTTYAITVKDSKNGDVTASHKSAAKGTTVTLTVDPDKGYVLDTLTVLDDKDKEIKLTEKNGKYVFTMPSGKVTVAGRFKVEQPAGKHPFTDIPSGAYYENAVIWAADKGITGGTSATTFAPNGICTRAQAVTFLWRAAGSPAPKSMNSFADVPADAYYAKAVAWAVENGITSGTGGGKFSPDATCTRAQIVTFLYRAAGSPMVSGGSVFSDVKAGAYYADAVTWAANKGITGGIGNGLFGSDNNCTRAQIVTFLYRYME